MPNFANGKIYKMISPHTDKVYIGSTTMTLKKRKDTHNGENTGNVKNKCRSHIIYDAGDWQIVEIEACPCGSRWELQQRERFHILNTPNAVNDRIPTDCKTRKEYFKKQRQKKKVENAETRKAYKAKPENAAKIKAREGAKDTCPNCGKTHRHDAKRPHQRTKTCMKIVDTEVNAVMKSMLDIICNE